MITIEDLKRTMRRSGDGLILDLKVHPGARKTEVTNVQENRLRVSIKEKPEGGKANEELRRFFSGILGVSKSSIILTHGRSSRFKTIAIKGDGDELMSRCFTSMVD